MTLTAGQYQIGDVVFGRGTLIIVNEFTKEPGTVVVSDYTLPNTDERRFGRDSWDPGSYSLTLAVLDNPPNEPAAPLVEQLAAEWRADEVRKTWGTLKPLLCGTKNGVRRIYGRPRKFAEAKASLKSEWIPIVADYTCADTLNYSDEEETITFDIADGLTDIVRAGGRAPTWLHAYITGPITNPNLKVGDYTIQMSYTIPAGKVVEINAYPWSRRVINNDGLNLAVTLTGTSPYMDQMTIPPNATVQAQLTGSGTTGATAASILVREAYLSL